MTSGEDGTTAGNVTIDSYANLQVGELTTNTINLTGVTISGNNITASRSNDDLVLDGSGTGSVVIATADINGGAIDGTIIGASTAAAGTFTDLTANGTIDIDSSGNMDGIIIGANTAAAGTFTAITGSSLTVSDGDITNVGDIALDSISADGNEIDITLTDNQANALEIKEGSNIYINIATTDSSELITINKDTTLANGTTLTGDTVQVNDNLTVNGQIVTDTIVSAASNANIAITPSGTGEVDISKVDIDSGEIDGTAIGANSASTGAFTTLSASGNTSIDGGTFTFNESAASVDFRAETSGQTHALFLDASEDHVGIMTSSPAYDLDVSGSTDAIRLPTGTTAQRPTAATGIIRFNSTTGKYEVCQDGSTFVNLAVAGDTPVFSKATATGDGSTTTFTGFFASAPANANNVFVYIDNVYQEPTENYTVSSNNITFTSAPHSSARIFAITGADNTALVSAGVARTETSSTDVSGSSAVDIFTFNANDYRAAEAFIIAEDSGNTNYEVAKAHIVHDGTTAYVTVYGTTNSSGTDLASYSVTMSGSTVKLQATANNSGTLATKVQYSLA